MGTPRSRPSSSFPDLWDDQRGFAALTLAAGALLILLAVAASITLQTKHSMRLSVADPEVTQIERLVVSEFTKAAAKAETASAAGQVWPNDFPDERSASSDEPCQPLQSWRTNRTYPKYCVQALDREPLDPGATEPPYYWQVRMRVRFQAAEGAEITTKYGWVITRQLTGEPLPKFWRIYYLHDWCVKQFPVGATGPSCVREG